MDDKTLVERLRVWRKSEFGQSPAGYMFEEAADTIEAQVTRIEALEIENAELYDREFTVKEERNKAEAKIEALEAALRECATAYNGYAAQIVAKQALEGTGND